MLLTYEEFPTLLTMPRWFGKPEVKVMPGKPDDYRIEQLHVTRTAARGMPGVASGHSTARVAQPTRR